MTAADSPYTPYFLTHDFISLENLVILALPSLDMDAFVGPHTEAEKCLKTMKDAAEEAWTSVGLCKTWLP